MTNKSVELKMNHQLHLRKKLNKRKTWVIKRHQMEEALIATERKYRVLFENSSDAIFISTLDGELIDINPAGVRLFGFDCKEELLQRNFEEIFHRDDAQCQLHRLTLQAAGCVADFETTVKTRDGQRRYVQESSTAITDASGKIVAYVGFLKDITLLRDLQQRLTVLSGYFGVLQSLVPKNDATQKLFGQIEHASQKED